VVYNGGYDRDREEGLGKARKVDAEKNSVNILILEVY